MTTSAGRLVTAVWLALALLLPRPLAAAAVEAEWGDPTATATYGEQIEFRQPVTTAGDPGRVELLVELPGAIGPVVVQPEAAEAQAGVLTHRLLISEGHLLPNTTVTARWRLTGEDGSEAVGPPVTVRYEDTRFDWRTREGDVVRVHWYEGSDDFGQRALDIAERSVRETADLLGVTEEEPVDFFVYADQGSFYDALGPGTRENVGGQANPDLRTMFALIPPDEIDDPWVGTVIPHELVHLVFDTAVRNPYHAPPRWLNEGLAVYRSQGYGVGDRSAVEQAAGDGSLIPLDGLTGQFPTTRERFFLAYAESVSAVDFLVRTHGEDALVALVRSYATGLTDDEAFERAIGMDVAGFDAAWRAALGAGEPREFGPRPAPPGRLPPGWSPTDPSADPSARPAAPAATNPPSSRAPGVDGGDDGFGVPSSQDDPAGPGLGTGAVVLLAAVAGALALFVIMRQRAARRRGGAPPARERPPA